MKYTPDHNGFFNGQNGYGYKSISAFLDGALAVNSGVAIDDIQDLAQLRTTSVVTAILEAGRLSLDNQSPYNIAYASDHWSSPTLITPC